MVLLCAARMLIINAPRLCYLVLKSVLIKCICMYLCHIDSLSCRLLPWEDRSRSMGHDVWTLVSASYRIMGYFRVAKFLRFCLKNMGIIFHGF